MAIFRRTDSVTGPKPEPKRGRVAPWAMAFVSFLGASMLATDALPAAAAPGREPTAQSKGDGDSERASARRANTGNLSPVEFKSWLARWREERQSTVDGDSRLGVNFSKRENKAATPSFFSGIRTAWEEAGETSRDNLAVSLVLRNSAGDTFRVDDPSVWGFEQVGTEIKYDPEPKGGDSKNFILFYEDPSSGSEFITLQGGTLRGFGWASDKGTTVDGALAPNGKLRIQSGSDNASTSDTFENVREAFGDTLETYPDRPPVSLWDALDVAA